MKYSMETESQDISSENFYDNLKPKRHYLLNKVKTLHAASGSGTI